MSWNIDEVIDDYAYMNSSSPQFYGLTSRALTAARVKNTKHRQLCHIIAQAADDYGWLRLTYGGDQPSTEREIRQRVIHEAREMGMLPGTWSLLWLFVIRPFVIPFLIQLIAEWFAQQEYRAGSVSGG